VNHSETEIPLSATTSAVQKPTRRKLTWFIFLLVAVNFIWAAQPTSVKFIPGDKLGPFAIALLTLILVIPFLLPLLWWKPKSGPGSARPNASDWIGFLIAGIGCLFAQLGMTWGFVVGQASSCAILYLMVPIFTAVWAPLILKERITRLRILCLGIGLVGVLIMSAKELKEANIWESNYFRGNLLFLAGCVSGSFYNVYSKKLMQKFTERDVLIYGYIVAAIASIPILLWKEPNCFQNLLELDTRAWMAVGFISFFVYGISMLVFFYVMQFLPVTVVVSSTYLIPVFGVVIAVVFLHEKLDTLTIIGAGIVLAATILILKYDSEVQPVSPESHAST
jgi:drug/metabolite transporter (DMT)-like permease